MSNKFDSQTLDNFYKYCKENPHAKEAVDKVIKAFSPDKIQTFLENCEDTPLPTNATSWEKFSTQYEQEIKQQKEAPKKETVVEKHNSVVVEDNAAMVDQSKESQKTAEKRKEIHDLLST